ncbi:hypothetical protein MMC13_004217 [Lambiella insularis]|nr:hypothetical protein [Lambiella insularis]
MEAWQSLHVNINVDNDFDYEPEGAASSMSSDFSSSGSLTSSSTSPYSSRRHSKCSENWTTQYPSRASTSISTSPTTPVDAHFFSLSSFRNASHAFVGPSELHWTASQKPYANQRRMDDGWSTMAEVSDEWSNRMELDDLSAFQHGQVILDAMNAHLPEQQSFPGMSGLPDVPEPADHVYCPPCPMFGSPFASPAPGCRFGGASGSGSQTMTVSPSQTLVNHPLTPQSTLATAFQTPVKVETPDWRYQFQERSSPMPSSTTALSDIHTIPSPTFLTPDFEEELEVNDVGARVRKGRAVKTTPKGPYVCDDIDGDGRQCSRRFRRREHLTRHCKTHTLDLTDPCPVCGIRLKGGRTDNLYSHIRKTHLEPTMSGRNSRDRAYTVDGVPIAVDGKPVMVPVTLEWLKEQGFDIEGTQKKKVKKEQAYETQKQVRAYSTSRRRVDLESKYDT